MADDPNEWLRGVPLPLGIVRRGTVLFANDALLRMIGRTREEVVGGRFIDFCAPYERDWVTERYRRRTAGEPVPDTYDLDVLHKDGTIVPTEVWLRGDPAGDTVLCQLCDRTERMKRARLLHELVLLGASLQAELSDDAIFETLTRGLDRMKVGWAFLAPEGERWRILASDGPGQEAYREALASVGVTPGEFNVPDPVGKLSTTWESGVAIDDDIPSAMGLFVSGPAGEKLRRKFVELGIMRGALLRIDRGTERLRVLVIVGNWIHEEDLPPLRLFAAQISSALEAARVIGDLSARNDALAALNRVAAAAGGEDDISRLFRIGGEELLHVMDAQVFVVHLLDEATQHIRLVYQIGLTSMTLPFTDLPLDRATNFASVIHSGVAQVFKLEDFRPEFQALFRSISLSTTATIPLTSRGRVIGVMNIAFSKERSISQNELELLQAAGTHFAAAVQTKRLLDDLRESYASLERTQQKLVQRERLAALGELAAVVAHEVRNPLGVIFNSASTLRRTIGDDPTKKNLVDILQEEAQRLNHIVGDLLDFARPLSPSLRREAMATIAEEAVGVALAATERPIAVTFEVEPGLPDVPVDRRLIRQALINVAMNAVQAMPRGGTLTTRLRREGARLRLEIEDTGTGIDDAVAKRIFEPFFTTRAQGTGLGLTVVKRITDVHGGEVSLQSQPGRGTTFRLLLPMERIEPSATVTATG
jgi:PAS domain S-box-containing protein